MKTLREILSTPRSLWLGLVGSAALVFILTFSSQVLAVPNSQSPGGAPNSVYLPIMETSFSQSPVQVYEKLISISAYPYEAYLLDVYSPLYNMTFPRLNWDSYLAAPQGQINKTFTGIVLENEFLRLTVLPELGGRIYECVFKVTGHNELYRNPVLKPTRWGPPEQGWWLAAGGIEWCLPVAEHGYESALPWHVEISRSALGSSVTVTNSVDTDRLIAQVEIHLPADSALFSISPHLQNLTDKETAFQFWLNAMLAPGGTNAPSEQLEFIYPTDRMTVHSRDTRWASLPSSGQALAWPLHRGIDLSRLGNWPYYLGCFERPAARGDFVAVYDHHSDEGMIRVFPSEMARGAKAFAAGYGKGAIPADLWTDDGSSYVEVHGGLTPTFDEYAHLAPGEQLSWTEYWYPVNDLGGVVYANRQAALNLLDAPEGIYISVVTTSRQTDTVVSLRQCAGGYEIFREVIASIDPSSPYRVGPILVEGIPKRDLCLSYFAADGSLLASY